MTAIVGPSHRGHHAARALTAAGGRRVCAPAPGRGSVALSEVDNVLFCGGPSEIYAIEGFSAPARKLVDDTEHLFGVLALEDKVFWMGQDSGLGAPSTVGWVDRNGGNAQRATQPGGHGRLVYGNSIDRLMHLSRTSLALIRPNAASYDPEFELGATPTDLASDSEFAYLGLQSWVNNARTFAVARIRQSALLADAP